VVSPKPCGRWKLIIIYYRGKKEFNIDIFGREFSEALSLKIFKKRSRRLQEINVKKCSYL